MTPSPTPTGRPDRTAGAHEPVPHRRSTALLALGVPVALVAVSLALVLPWRVQLPDPVAVHWGPDGVDGFSSVLPFLAGTAGVALAMAVACWAVGHTVGRQAMTRRVLNGTAVWLAAFLGGLLVTTLEAQRGLADAADAVAGDAALAMTFAGATVLGALVAWLTPGDARRPAETPIPVGAPVLDLGATEQAAWVGEVGRRSTLVVVGAALAFSAAIAALSGLWWFGAVLAVVLAAVLTTMLRWTVTVDGTGLTARSLLRRPYVHVPLDEVESAEVVDVDPLGEFGGWGMRIGLDGRTGVVLRRGPAIQVRRSGGRVVVVTVPDAATGAALLNTLAARTRTARA